jgi:hypothetical protein
VIKACLYFSTLIGLETDRDHLNHFIFNECFQSFSEKPLWSAVKDAQGMADMQVLSQGSLMMETLS